MLFPTSKIQRATRMVQTGAKVGVNYIKYYGDKITKTEQEAKLRLNENNAEDITIQTFSKAFDKIHTFNDQYVFKTWLISISKNVHIDLLRKKNASISDEELNTFEINGSNFHGHATRNLLNGIEFSGGSLGLGVPYAVGVAIAGKLSNIDYSVYVIVGDGECNEGIIWESLMSAAHYKLDNFILIVDDNKLQYDGESEKVLNIGSLESKFKSFGFETYSINGHEVSEIYSVLTNFKTDKPKAIIANTIKGKGVSFMENKKEWHHSRLTLEQYNAAILEQRHTNDI